MLKRFSLGLLVAFFSFCLVTVAVLAATNAVFGKPDTLKQTLAESGAYNGFSAGLVDQVATTNAEKTQQSGIDPAILKQVGEKVLTPTKVQSYAEQIIDGTYNWLEGETAQPEFNLNVGSLQTEFGGAVGDVAVDRVQKLPLCTYQQLAAMDTRDIDPFNLKCRPPGINLAAERAKLVKEVANTNDTLADSSLTAADLKDKESGQTPFQNLSFLPTLFQWSKAWPIILGVLGLATAAGVIFWSEDRNKAVKRLSIKLIVTGVVLLVGIWLTSFVLSRANLGRGVEATQMNDALLTIVKTLSSAFNRILLIFAIIYAAAGVGGLVWVRVKTPKVAPVSSSPPKATKK